MMKILNTQKRLVTCLGLVLCLWGMSTQTRANPSTVTLVEQANESGLSDEVLTFLRDSAVETITVSSQGAQVVMHSPPPKITNKCDDDCLSKVATAHAAMFVVLYRLTPSKDKMLGSVTRYNAETNAIDGVKTFVVENDDVLMREALMHAVGSLFFTEDQQIEADQGDTPVLPSASTTAQVLPAYYADFTVVASGIKDVTREAVEVTANVFINGQYVGKTPYEDGLPRGKYHVRVEAEGVHNDYEVDVVPGALARIAASLVIPLTAAEKEKMRWETEQRRQEQQRKEVEFWQNELDAWNQKNREIQQKRKPFIWASGMLMGGGIGLTILGSVALSRYRKQRDNYDLLLSWYWEATAPEVIVDLREQLDSTSHTMQKNKVLAAVFLPVGITSVLTSIVLLAVMPKKKKPLNVPSSVRNQLSVRLEGFGTTHFAYVGLRGTF